MTDYIFFFLGLPVGIAASIFAWWIVTHAIQPKMSWHNIRITRIKGEISDDATNLGVFLKNDRSREALDIVIHSELRVDHPMSSDEVTKTVIRFPLNTDWHPFIKVGVKLRIELSSIDESEWERLSNRIGIVVTDLPTLKQEYGSGVIRFCAIAYDSFSGARKLFLHECDLNDVEGI